MKQKENFINILIYLSSFLNDNNWSLLIQGNTLNKKNYNNNKLKYFANI